ncbi:MAG: hypothetical protein Q9169_006536, partial [Polycauliona sp. 2 TL-2023]
SKERKDYVANTYCDEYSRCGSGGIRSIGRALICTQLIVAIKPKSIMLSAIYRTLWRSFGRVDSNYELGLQVAAMRKQPAYVPKDTPPPTIFEIRLHSKADQVCAKLDEYFFKNWPWPDKAAGQKFLRSETNRWACLALPDAMDDRIYDAVRVNTLLFLLDDVAETLSIAEGKALYKRLIPIALGQTLPDRNDPYEWITYDTWESMRATDPELTEVVWQGALLCVMAQVDEARMTCPDIGSLLKHREKEAGIAFVAAVSRFAGALHITAADIASIGDIHTSYALLGVTVNDILSFDKEVRALRQAPDAEGAHMLNMTQALAKDTELDFEASKRVLWVLCREWEVRHQRMVKERMERKGVSRDLEQYLKCLELTLGGNEWWSWRTARIKLDRSASTSVELHPHHEKASTRDIGTSCGEQASTLAYLDAAVQVNESMLVKKERRFAVLELGGEDDLSQKLGKPIIHQYHQCPEAIPEESIDVETPSREQSTASSPCRPKSALRVTSQESSSADSFHSNKTASDSGSSKSKQVSWEHEPKPNKKTSEDATKGNTSGAATPPQSRRRQSSDGRSNRIQRHGSARVLDLLPVSAQTAFQTFCNLCANSGFLDRAAGLEKEDSQEGVNDEVTLFRFFTARKLDIHGAYNQFQAAHETRGVNNVLKFFDCMDVDDYEETRKLYPHWVGRRDKRGLPICIFDFGKLDSKTMNAYREASASIYGMQTGNSSEHAVSAEVLRSFVVYDSLTRFVMPFCSGAAGGPDPVHKTLQLVDITGIGIRQVWNMRGYVQDLARLLSGNYPEILDHVLLIGAPSYFSTIWGSVKKWVDPGTIEKIRVIPQGEVLSTLKEFIEVADIPTRFGGQFEYEPGMPYSLDPAIARRLVWKSRSSDNKLPKGPIKWVETGDGSKMAVAVGSHGGKERREELAVMR